MICLHVPIDYRNVSMVNFARGQKVVHAGWLLIADGPEISLAAGAALYFFKASTRVYFDSQSLLQWNFSTLQ